MAIKAAANNGYHLAIPLDTSLLIMQPLYNIRNHVSVRPLDCYAQDVHGFRPSSRACFIVVILTGSRGIPMRTQSALEW